MTSPLDRSAGSSQVLRYRTLVEPAAVGGGEFPTPVPLATFPKPNATFPSNTPIVSPLVINPANPLSSAPYFVAYARFALFDPGPGPGVLDPVALANQARRFPSYVYDSGQPVDTSLAPPIVLPNIPGGINAGELALNQRTWAQNIQVRSSNLDLNVVAADLGWAGQNNEFSDFLTVGCFLLLDTLTSGLGMNTGLPVLVVPFRVLAQSNGQIDPTFTLQPFFVDLTIEIAHSIGR